MEKEKLSMQSIHRGITLISLVITIIILLILAGVTISLIMGENGIFEIAQNAAKEYENSAQKEEVGINNLTNQIEKYGIASNGGTITIDKNEYEKLKEKLVNLENRYYPNKSLNLTLVNNQVTIPKSGWLYIYFNKNTQGEYFYANRNEVRIFDISCPTEDTCGSTYIPVNEGDVIRVSASSYFTLNLRYHE